MSQIDFNLIPSELKGYSQWVVWKYTEREGKKTKIPVSPKTGRNAESDDSSTWSSFSSAVSYYTEHRNEIGGIGFMFSQDDPYTGIDLDDCLKDGELNQKAMEVVEKFNSYTEISPSGAGIHIITRAEKPGDRCRTGKVEIYDKLRYFTFTGNVINGKDTITDGQQALNEFYDKLFEQKQTAEQKTKQEQTKATISHFDDQDLIDLAMNAKNGDKFKALWRGDTSGYESHSEADLAFCSMLAFWTGGDKDRIDRLFRASGLNRDKWTERDDYRNRTIDEAISSQTEYYKPQTQTQQKEPQAREFDLASCLDDIPETIDKLELAVKVEGILKKALRAGKAKEILNMWINHKLKTRYELDENDVETYHSMLDNLLKDKSKVDKGYFRENSFIPKRLADELMSENTYIYSGSRLYVYQDGVYRYTGEVFVKNECRKKLGEDSRINRIKEVIAHISDLCYVDANALNTQRNLINLKNGMYNWIEDKLLPHDPKYLSTIRIPVEYNPEAKCPEVDRFLETTIPPDCIPIIEELLGYAMIPDTKMEKAFMLLGAGANGKSTFLKLLEAFVGSDNVSKVPLQEIADNRFKRAELYGKLINLFADLSSRAIETSSYFKAIVSGDSMNVERKHKDPFDFEPFCRLVFSANEPPTSADKTFAYYRRWIIIPFPYVFKGKKADKSLLSKITTQQELSGLFNRALIGLRRLFTQKDFSDSKTVREELEVYKAQNDPIEAFVMDCCEFEPETQVERQEIFSEYCKYCKLEQYKIESNRKLYDKLRAYQGVGEKKLRDGKRVFTGIRIKV